MLVVGCCRLSVVCSRFAAFSPLTASHPSIPRVRESGVPAGGELDAEEDSETAVIGDGDMDPDDEAEAEVQFCFI